MEKRQSIYKKTVYFLLIAFIAIAMILSGQLTLPAYADSINDVVFDDTYVLDDLQSSEDFDLTDYPYDFTGLYKRPEIITVVEYCYSVYSNLCDNYGIYIYFYNPQAKNISATSVSNCVTMTVAWEKLDDGTVRGTRFEKFSLKFCSKSTGDYANLFYKFKVVDHRSTYDNKFMVERVNSNSRRYDISEIELHTDGELKATAYTVGGSYAFSGYVAGYGVDSNSSSTLSCTAEKMEVIELDVNTTYWRTPSSYLGVNYQNQINSAYFAVPNSILEKYGNLQKVRASWFRVKTDILCITDNDKFIALYCDDDDGVPSHTHSCGGLGVGFWLIKSDSKDDYISSSQLYDYIITHRNSKENMNCLPVGDGNTVPLCLFNAEIKSGGDSSNPLDYQVHNTIYTQSVKVDEYLDCYQDMTIDAGDFHDLLSYSDTHNWWQTANAYGFWNTLWGNVPKDDSLSIKPIEAVTSTDLSYNGAALSNRLYIEEHDVSEFKAYSKKAIAEDKTPFLFRFSVSDYYREDMSTPTNDIGYLNLEEAHEWMFFDFDIIELTFWKDDVYTVLPVVASPVDLIPSLTPRPNFGNSSSNLLTLLKAVLIVLLIILLIWFLAKTGLLAHIINGFVWLVKAPFRAIASLFKRRPSNSGKSKVKAEPPTVNVTVNIPDKAFKDGNTHE